MTAALPANTADRDLEPPRWENEQRHDSARVLEVALTVMATGFAPQQEDMRRLVEEDVADKVGPVRAIDDAGQLRTTCGARLPSPGCGSQ